MWVPSGLYATASTSPAWPMSVVSWLPVVAFHTIAFLSMPAVTIRVPPGLNTTESTPSGGPPRCRCGW